MCFLCITNSGTYEMAMLFSNGEILIGKNEIQDRTQNPLSAERSKEVQELTSDNPLLIRMIRDS
jgi:hypothetical protein